MPRFTIVAALGLTVACRATSDGVDDELDVCVLGQTVCFDDDIVQKCNANGVYEDFENCEWAWWCEMDDGVAVCATYDSDE